jgi:hypothetical protein
MKRYSIILALLLLASSAFSIHKDPTKDRKPVFDATEAQKNAELRLNTVKAFKDDSTTKEHEKPEIAIQSGDTVAASAVAAVAGFADRSKSGEAPAAPVEAPSSPSKGPMGALFLGGGVFLIFWVVSKRQER